MSGREGESAAGTSFFAVTYPKPAGQVGARRQIKVRVEQPGLIVLARDSYTYAQKENSHIN